MNPNLKSRAQHFHKIARWGWFVLFEAGWTLVFVNVDFVIMKWGSPETKASWERLLHPHFGWKIWVIGTLGLALIFLLEGSYRLTRSLVEEKEQAVAEIQGELNKEIANRARPEVGVRCDWKLDRSTNISIPYHPKALILRTLTPIAAFDVEVQEIKQAKGTAKFKVVSRLDGNTEVAPICTIERGNAVFAMWDLHSLVEQSAQGQGLKMSEIAIPIIVDYKDSHGTSWQGVYELRYDPFLDVAQAHLQGFRRKI
jgi:hypothetical protein